ncbi:MAG: rhodanese-related sulfurtransferase [Fimbriimonadales bacterium]
MPFRVLLFYKFVLIEDHVDFARAHLGVCRSLDMRGRIIIAPEGINGTASGTAYNARKYMDVLHSDARFADMEFKADEAHEHAFKKLFVRARSEIIGLGVPVDMARTGNSLTPTEFREALNDPESIILDGRNNYEHVLGRFRNAMMPDVENFRDFPRWIENNLLGFKNKRIVTYCTGGIRCEKLTAYLFCRGFSNVSQLAGGIVSYAKDPDVRGDLFDGRCYVFDERISTSVNSTPSQAVITTCAHCGEPSDQYVNCANVICNIQFFCCEECEREMSRCCSRECIEAPLKRKKAGKLARVF